MDQSIRFTTPPETPTESIVRYCDVANNAADQSIRFTTPPETPTESIVRYCDVANNAADQSIRFTTPPETPTELIVNVPHPFEHIDSRGAYVADTGPCCEWMCSCLESLCCIKLLRNLFNCNGDCGDCICGDCNCENCNCGDCIIVTVETVIVGTVIAVRGTA